MYNNDNYNDIDDKYDKLIKIILIGDSAVGKSNILSRFLNDEFIHESKSTISVEFGTRTISLGNIKIKAQIWDTAGQERYQSIIRAYYRGSHGVLLIYDITNKNSFLNIEKWCDEIRKYAPEDIKILLVGNKSDLISLRQVQIKDGMILANDIKSLFIETSAFDNSNIDLAFAKLIEYICESLMIDTINSNNNNNKKSDVTSGNIIIESINNSSHVIEKNKKCCDK